MAPLEILLFISAILISELAVLAVYMDEKK